MRRMAPSILRFQPEPPDGPELRHFLRQAGALIAASEPEQRPLLAVADRARAWITAAQNGLDELIEQQGIPSAITDRPTQPLGGPADKDRS